MARTPNTSTEQRRSPLLFFSLTFALSLPFWWLGASIPLEIAPGLPLSSLGVFCPAMAALLLAYRENGSAGAIALLKRSFDLRRIETKIWYAPVVLLMPGVMAASYGLMRAMGVPLPPPQFPVLAPLVLLMAFFVTALGEELGWSGYVIDPMQERWGALGASVLVGLVWCVWHFVPLLQAHRSSAWIAWWCLGTVAVRVLIVWLYNNTGKSVFAAALFHATQNVTWLLFPIYGSHYDPRVTGSLLALLAAAVTIVWGPRTLTRRR